MWVFLRIQEEVSSELRRATLSVDEELSVQSCSPLPSMKAVELKTSFLLSLGRQRRGEALGCRSQMSGLMLW